MARPRPRGAASGARHPRSRRSRGGPRRETDPDRTPRRSPAARWTSRTRYQTYRMLGMSRLLLVVCALAACRAEAGVGSGAGSGGPAVHVSLGSGGSDDLPKLEERGGLSFEIVDEATGKRMPGKITLLGAKGTKEPRFSKDIGVEID